MDAGTVLCPNCKQPRVAAEECPRCGVIYSKADVRALQAAEFSARAEPLVDTPPAVAWDGDVEDARLEFRLRLFAIPVALLSAAVAVQSGMLHMLMRIFLSMWVHESGHAVTSWFCGYAAFPLPWVTPTSQDRVWWISAGLLAALIAVGVHFGRQRRWLIVGAAVVGVGLQAVGTLLFRPAQARMWITFGGDGGALVLGTLLMLSVYADARGSVRREWLRWGFLVIGACAFADVFEMWWAARTNFDRIPFGEIEGVGLSDPSRLVERDGWTYQEMIGRYVGLGVSCLVLLTVAYVKGLRDARREQASPGGVDAAVRWKEI
jgi:hypothetical protein